MSAPPSIEDDFARFSEHSDPPPPFTETDPANSQPSRTRSSATFTLSTNSTTDTPIQTSSPHSTPSYIIPTALSSTSSNLKLYRSSPSSTNWRDSEPVWTLYYKNPVFPANLLTSPSLRVSIRDSIVGRNFGKSVVVEPSGRALLDISYIGGIISECSVEQNAVARMFDYKTGEGEKLWALEVYEAGRLRKDRLDLVIAVWVSLVWNGQARKMKGGPKVGMGSRAIRKILGHLAPTERDMERHS